MSTKADPFCVTCPPSLVTSEFETIEKAASAQRSSSALGLGSDGFTAASAPTQANASSDSAPPSSCSARRKANLAVRRKLTSNGISVG